MVYSPVSRPRLLTLKATAVGAHSLLPEGGNFGWMSAWELNPRCQIRVLYRGTTGWHFGETAVPGGERVRVVPDFFITSWHLPYN
jgi:hypothetical protein